MNTCNVALVSCDSLVNTRDTIVETLRVTAYLGNIFFNPGQVSQFFFLQHRVLLVPLRLSSFSTLPVNICAFLV